MSKRYLADTLTDYVMVTIDPLGAEVDRLGPANAEQRADRKKQRRAERRAALRRAGLLALFYLVLVTGVVLGLVLGATNADLVLGVLS